MGASQATVRRISNQKANAAASRVRYQLSREIAELQRQQEKNKQELDNQKTIMAQQARIEKLERLKLELELKARNAIEDEEETKNKCQCTCNTKFEGEFGATVLDLEKAPKCYIDFEGSIETLSGILSHGIMNTKPLNCEKNQELVPKLRQETGWAKRDCEKVVKWYWDPESRTRESDPDVIERKRYVTDIAVMNFKDLEDQNQIVMAVDNLFADLRGKTRALLRDVAMNCMNTVKQAVSLESVERSKTDEVQLKVDVDDEENFGQKKTLTFRVRTALCFKYLKTTLEIEAPQVMGAPQVMRGEAEEILEQQAEDVRVVVAFRTTVHQMKTVEGSMNQAQTAAVADLF